IPLRPIRRNLMHRPSSTHPRPRALWICLTLCRLFLGRVSRQALLAKSGGLGDHIAMALLLIGDASLALLLALEWVGGALSRCIGASLVVVAHFRNLTPGLSPSMNSIPRAHGRQLRFLSLTPGASPFVKMTPAHSSALWIASRSLG